MAKIRKVHARKILDSRGESTLETEIILDNDIKSTASVPSGASTGMYEAKIANSDNYPENRDENVKKAIENVNQIIAAKIEKEDVGDQKKIDKLLLELDGTQTKAGLGANAMLSVSIAAAKAAALTQKLPLWLYIKDLKETKTQKNFPTPILNCIEGGKHADNGLEFQEFLVVPASSKHIAEAINLGSKIYFALKNYLKVKNATVLSADEGGFAPSFSNNENALKTLKFIIDQENIQFAEDVFLGIDAAANTFAKGNKYSIHEVSGSANTKDMVDFYERLYKEYTLLYIEDPFGENDIEGWKKIYERLGSKTQIVGDDLTTTNPYRLQFALENNTINGMVIKPNQIGTLTETLAVVEIAQYKGIKLTVSHRSGETEDVFIADFAVGIGADYVKFGAPARERVVKYNRLLKIQQEHELLNRG